MASVRFPGKPLALINGVPMVIRVYRQVAGVLPNVVIASGDREIEEAADQFGAAFVRTLGDHQNGTSRCREAFETWSAQSNRRISALLNIQGDEPAVSPEAVAQLAADISRSGSVISTLIRKEPDLAEANNPNRVKVVVNTDGNALYFSRSPIPYHRSGGSGWLVHVGMYAFRREVFTAIGKLPPGILETAESLEQLRWLENGLPIHCCETDYRGFGVDTPDDLSELLASGLV